MTGARSLRIERSAIVDNTAFGQNSFGSAIAFQGGTSTDHRHDHLLAHRTRSGLVDRDRSLRWRRGDDPPQHHRLGGPSRNLIGNFAFGTATVDRSARPILQASGSSCVGRDPANGPISLVVFDSGNNIESGDTCGLLAFKGNLVYTPCAA